MNDPRAVDRLDPEAGLPEGVYVALLSHSGSRGTGAAVCQHYSKLAMAKRSDLPKPLAHLAWLDPSSHEGQEYWAAMELTFRIVLKTRLFEAGALPFNCTPMTGRLLPVGDAGVEPFAALAAGRTLLMIPTKLMKLL